MTTETETTENVTEAVDPGVFTDAALVSHIDDSNTLFFHFVRAMLDSTDEQTRGFAGIVLSYASRLQAEIYRSTLARCVDEFAKVIAAEDREEALRIAHAELLKAASDPNVLIGMFRIHLQSTMATPAILPLAPEVAASAATAFYAHTERVVAEMQALHARSQASSPAQDRAEG